MNCEDVRGVLIDALVARRPPADPAVLAHLESCAACRAARADYERLWHELGELDSGTPAPAAVARFGRRLAMAEAAPLRRSVGLSRYVGALAATLVLAALLAGGGYWAGAHRSGAPSASAAAVATGTEPTFVLLLHVDSTFRAATSPAQAKSMEHEYDRWARGLAPAGMLVDGERLQNEPISWLGPSHAATARGDMVDGFIMIRAKDAATAQRLAATCPHLKYGGRVELREIDPT